MKSGVPFDVAFSLSDNERAAWSIVMSEFEGNEFDWSSMSFKDPE